MKVVINRKYGGFGLSDQAVEACITLGMTVCDEKDTVCDKDDAGTDFVSIGNRIDFTRRSYWCPRENDKAFRCDSRVVQVVEKLGDEACDIFAALKVVEIPFDTFEGWEIYDRDGMESIEENHNTWK